jgi:hypothetical protein
VLVSLHALLHVLHTHVPSTGVSGAMMQVMHVNDAVMQAHTLLHVLHIHVPSTGVSGAVMEATRGVGLSCGMDDLAC